RQARFRTDGVRCDGTGGFNPGAPPPVQLEADLDGRRPRLPLGRRSDPALLLDPGRQLQRGVADRVHPRPTPALPGRAGDPTLGPATLAPEPDDDRVWPSSSTGWTCGVCPPTRPSSTRSRGCGRT